MTIIPAITIFIQKFFVVDGLAILAIRAIIPMLTLHPNIRSPTVRADMRFRVTTNANPINGGDIVLGAYDILFHHVTS